MIATARPHTRRIALLNPNTNHQTTQRMLHIARAALAALELPTSITIEGHTAARGEPLITSEAALRAAAQEVVSEGGRLAHAGYDALIVAAFGDPGLETLREQLSTPVLGIAESALLEAGAQGRRFSIVTITPDLHTSIAASVVRYGQHPQLASIRYTEGDPRQLANDPIALQQALLTTSRRAITEDGADAIVIGGGPLAPAAHAIRHQLAVPVIEPVASAVQRACALL